MNARAFRHAVATDQQAAVMRALEAAYRETFGALQLLEAMRISGRTVAATDLVCDAVTKIEDAQGLMRAWLVSEENESPMQCVEALRSAP